MNFVLNSKHQVDVIVYILEDIYPSIFKIIA